MKATQALEKPEVISLLQEAGITPTRQRLEIARLLFACPQHLSADQLLARLNGGQATVSKATVYNTLGLFARKGLLREVVVEPGKLFYDSNTSHHHHLYDIDSGELSDLADDALAFQGEPRLPEGLETVDIDVVVRVRRSDA